MPGLAERLAEVAARVEPFVVTTGAAGAFPRPGAAQSAWLGITDPGPGDRLAGLAEWVQAAVLPPDQRRRLRAHLTLGRSRARRGEPLGDWLAARTFPPMPIRVDELILHLKQAFKMTIIVVTHELVSAFLIADRMCMLHKGKMIAVGTREAIRGSNHPRIRQFLDRIPDEAGVDEAEALRRLMG